MFTGDKWVSHTSSKISAWVSDMLIDAATLAKPQKWIPHLSRPCSFFIFHPYLRVCDCAGWSESSQRINKMKKKKTWRRMETGKEEKEKTTSLGISIWKTFQKTEWEQKKTPKRKHKDGDGKLEKRWKKQPGNWSENKTVCCMKSECARESMCERKSIHPAVLASVGAG